MNTGTPERPSFCEDEYTRLDEDEEVARRARAGMDAGGKTTMKKDEIVAWQHRYRARPGVWGVLVANEPTGNLYDSKEAAEVEVAWCRARGRRGARVVFEGHMHDLQLARERWV